MTHDKPMVPTGPNDVIGPDRFGPSLWQGLHYISLGYPVKPTEEQKQKYKAFFLLLKDTLPCSICANHYAENLKKMPITEKVLETRENLVKWLIDFHNVVNEMKGKEIIEYKVARKMIDTDVHCKPNIRVIERFEEKEESKSESKLSQNKTKPSENSNDNSNIKFIYGMVGVLVTLILIAVIYKKN
jgi:hypothetical protein